MSHITRQQLAIKLCISRSTLSRRIKELRIDVPKRKMLSPKMVKEIEERLGIDSMGNDKKEN